VWYYLYHLQENPEYARALMLEMRVNRNFAKTKTFEPYRPLTHKILEIIEEGQEEGITRRDVNIYVIRHLILGMLEHIVTRWLLKGEKGNLLDQYNEAVELLIQGIRESEKRR
jgi:TetR/AcrR family fatty acid metabolism transcriptional regulator